MLCTVLLPTILQQANNYSKQQQWSNAERCYARALHLQEAALEKRYTLQRQSAEGLADVYERYGNMGQKGVDEALDDGLKAAALLNYALRVREKQVSEESKQVDVKKDSISQQLRNKIAKLEMWFLRKLKRDPSNNTHPYHKAIPHHQARLNSLREYVREQLHRLAEDLTRISKQSATAKTHEARVIIEAPWSRDIQALCATITSKMKGFVRELLEECIDTLGKPPCEYAVLCFGSFARGEVTPYSDLEFGFLLPEGKSTESHKQYYRNLTRLLHLKVINLGETILPAMTIRSSTIEFL